MWAWADGRGRCAISDQTVAGDVRCQCRKRHLVSRGRKGARGDREAPATANEEVDAETFRRFPAGSRKEAGAHADRSGEDAAEGNVRSPEADGVDMAETIRLEVDGIPMAVEPGTTLLEAGQMAEGQVPTICYHEATTSNGLCRMCVVEVEGQRLLQPACIVKAAPDMKVRTKSERVVRARRPSWKCWPRRWICPRPQKSSP